MPVPDHHPPEFTARASPDALTDPTPFITPSAAEAQARPVIAEIKGRQWRLLDDEVEAFLLRHGPDTVRLFRRWREDDVGTGADELLARHTERYAGLGGDEGDSS